MTQPIVLDVTVTVTGVDPYGHERIALHASGQIDRNDFGLTWSSALDAGNVLVAHQVTIAADVSAVKTVGDGKG